MPPRTFCSGGGGEGELMCVTPGPTFVFPGVRWGKIRPQTEIPGYTSSRAPVSWPLAPR